MTMTEIKNRFTGKVLYSGKGSIKEVSVKAIKKADLRYADLTNADLTRVNLTDANLTSAKGLPETPIVEDLDKKMFEATKVELALDMGHGHCGTSHGRAGWAVT